mgnify:CR=1 FL=1
MAQPEDDESFLAEVFERASEGLAAGEPLDAEEILAARPHLRVRILELVRLAEQVRVLRPESLPVVPGYELVRELGRGAAGTVYLARRLALDGRLVALKILPAPFGAS